MNNTTRTENCEKQNVCAHVKEQKQKQQQNRTFYVRYGVLKSLFGLDCVRSSNMFTPYWPISSLNANSLNFQCILDTHILHHIDDSDAPISINKSIWFMCVCTVHSVHKRLWSTDTWRYSLCEWVYVCARKMLYFKEAHVHKRGKHRTLAVRYKWKLNR